MINLHPANCSRQDVKFAYPDGCVTCVNLAYDTYPFLNWTQFCAAFAQSREVRDGFDLAGQIKSGVLAQPFKVRGSVQSTNSLCVELSKPYLALTDDDIIQNFKVAADTLDPDLRFITCANEDGETSKFYLFEDSDFRRVTFKAKRMLDHNEHLLDASNMLRKEQPHERFQVLAKEEVAARLGKRPGANKPCSRILSIADAKQKAEQIIQSRESAEKTGFIPSDSAQPVTEDVFEGIDAIKPSASFAASGGLHDPKSKARAKAKAKGTAKKDNPSKAATPTARRTRGRGAPDGRSRSPPASVAPPSDAPSSGGPDVSSGHGAPDELAKAIKARIGGDTKSVQNLNVVRVLQGEQLGRTLNGATRILRVGACLL